MEVDDEIEIVLKTIDQCFAFRIPPQVSASGHRADSWPTEPNWSGKLVITSLGSTAFIKLVGQDDGKIFASCPVKKNDSSCISKVADSSRYFVIRIEDQKTGRHAFIGIAFENRGDAFDFNVAIDDFRKLQTREDDLLSKAKFSTPTALSKDYSLKEGQTIRIQLNSSKTKQSETKSNNATVRLGMNSMNQEITACANSSNAFNNLVDFSEFSSISTKVANEKSTTSSTSISGFEGWETFK